MKNVPKKHNLIKRVVCGLLAVLLLYVAVSVAASAVVFHIAFKRTEYPRTTELNYEDVDPALYPREPVSFASGRNTLQGYLYPRENALGTVVVVNGVFSVADRHLSEIMFFLDHGWQVFAFDGTGVGQSTGGGIVGLQQTKLDLSAAVEALGANPKTGDKPLVLYGHSAGGYASVTVLGSVPGVAAAVSIAGFNSPVETMFFHMRRKVGLLADVEYPFLWLQNRFLFGKDADIRADDVLNRTETPVMIVEGSEDNVVPETIGIGRYSADCANPNLEYCYIDAPYRNTHTTIWLSDNAAKNAAAVTAREEETALSVGERLRLNEVDPAFMRSVLAFYESAVG